MREPLGIACLQLGNQLYNSQGYMEVMAQQANGTPGAQAHQNFLEEFGDSWILEKF